MLVKNVLVSNVPVKNKMIKLSKRKISAIVVLNDKKEALVLKRSADARSYPDHWNFPGGSVEPNETIETAAVRELEEEAGIKVSEDSISYFQAISLEKMVIHYFITNEYSGDVSINWESSDYMWVPLDKINKLKFIPLPIGMVEDIAYYANILYSGK